MSSASMLDEVQVPSSPTFLICPCCIFSFTELPKFIAHCEAQKAAIDAAVVKAKAEAARPKAKAQP